MKNALKIFVVWILFVIGVLGFIGWACAWVYFLAQKFV